MPERAWHIGSMITAELMVFAVLMLSVAQFPFEAFGCMHHAHVAHHHRVVDVTAQPTPMTM